jgi:hypothetical protein
MTFRHLAAVLLLALAQSGGRAQWQDRTDLENRVLALVRDFAQTSDVQKWWTQNGGRVTQETVDKAHDMGTQAAEHHAGDEAKVFYGFASIGYLRLGDRLKALSNMLDLNEIDFMMADTPEQYRHVRSSALSLSQRAEDLKGAADVQFRIALLAADCTFFSGRPENDASPDETWMQAVLSDIIPALEKARANTPSAEQERFASLVADVLSLAESRFFASQEKIDVPLKKVAESLDATFPTDFAYRTEMGSADKTVRTASAFAEVSYRYGDAAAASARLAIVAAKTHASGDLEDYLNLLYERYRGERLTHHPPAQLRQLRSDARAVVTEIRSKYHSRGGRIWNAYEMDSSYGEMLRDELREEGRIRPIRFSPPPKC